MTIAVVTPSHRMDAWLCGDLNRSLSEFLPTARHYIVADYRDHAQFRRLVGPQTEVLVSQEVLPKGFVQIPGWGRWTCPWTPRPMGGWLMQQIMKIACATVIEEDLLLLIDSDTCLVRTVDPASLMAGGRFAFYARPDGITEDMHAHLLWYHNGCRLLDVTPITAPVSDYISSIIPWKASIVRAMIARVEEVSGDDWWKAIARTPQFSEYLLYGSFVDQVVGEAALLRRDEHDHCLAHWDLHPLKLDEVEGFVSRFKEGDYACLISSHSGTSAEVRERVMAALREI